LLELGWLLGWGAARPKRGRELAGAIAPQPALWGACEKVGRKARCHKLWGLREEGGFPLSSCGSQRSRSSDPTPHPPPKRPFWHGDDTLGSNPLHSSSSAVRPSSAQRQSPPRCRRKGSQGGSAMPARCPRDKDLSHRSWTCRRGLLGHCPKSLFPPKPTSPLLHPLQGHSPCLSQA